MYLRRKPNVLIVDDDPTIRLALAEVLYPICAHIVTANNAKEGLCLVEDEAFDVLLTDLNMPVSSGMGLLQLAKAGGWDLATILITGIHDPRAVVDAFRSG